MRSYVCAKVLGAALLVLVLQTQAAMAQQGSVEIRGTAGAVQKYLDESFPDHWGAGSSVRFYISNRFAIEPEILYARSRWSDFVQESRLVVQPNLVYDLSRRGRISPYLIGGLGYERFRGIEPAPRFTDSRLTGSGGIGVKVFLSDRVFVAPQVRAPVLQITGSIGLVLRR